MDKQTRDKELLSHTDDSLKKKKKHRRKKTYELWSERQWPLAAGN